MKESNNHILCPSVFIREFGRENAFWAMVAIVLFAVSIPYMAAPLHILCTSVTTLFAANVLVWMALSINKDIFKP